MKPYLAIVRTENNRIAKVRPCETQDEADAHVVRYGGFSYDNSANTPLRDLWIDGQTVTIVPVVDPVPTDEERIDSAFPLTDIAKVIFEAFFEIANRLQTLEGKQPITRGQLKDWLKAKLP